MAHKISYADFVYNRKSVKKRAATAGRFRIIEKSAYKISCADFVYNRKNY